MPVWQQDEDLRESLDGALREKLLAWGASAGHKVLVVGALWPRLAIDLAKNDMFVTVVEDDPERARRISDAAAENGLLTTVTVIASDYVGRSFEPGAFHLTVIWDALNRYSEYDVILKKVTRELKTGGQLFVRARVKALGSSGHGAIDRASFMAQMEELLVINEVIPHHASASRVASMAIENSFFRKMVGPALALDSATLAVSAGLSRYVAVMAVKEKQLGKVSLNLRA
jgi:precorrin-6B methylase 2